MPLFLGTGLALPCQGGVGGPGVRVPAKLFHHENESPGCKIPALGVQPDQILIAWSSLGWDHGEGGGGKAGPGWSCPALWFPNLLPLPGTEPWSCHEHPSKGSEGKGCCCSVDLGFSPLAEKVPRTASLNTFRQRNADLGHFRIFSIY